MEESMGGVGLDIRGKLVNFADGLALNLDTILKI